MTNDLKGRVYFHKNPESTSEKIPFTAKYNCHHLVYFERFEFIESAIDREKQLKKWNRSKKEELINKFNPKWTFLENNLE